MLSHACGIAKADNADTGLEESPQPLHDPVLRPDFTEPNEKPFTQNPAPPINPGNPTFCKPLLSDQIKTTESELISNHFMQPLVFSPLKRFGRILG
jgi:hypothetical protein